MLRGFFQRKQQPRAGVVGSVLIDIIASTDEENRLDAVGRVATLNIGGCAYNIAYYLRQLKFQVSLFTVLKDRSILTPFIIRKLEREKIGRRFIFFDRDVPEGVFVAHHRGQQVDRAVTSTCVDAADLDLARLEEFISRCDVVACDMGLSVQQLSNVLEGAGRLRKNVICNATSDSRVTRIKGLHADRTMFALVMNADEARCLIPDLDTLLKRKKYSEIRRLAHARNVIITQGADGVICVTSDDELCRYAPINVPNVQSTVGAGDALTACVVASSVSLEPGGVLCLDRLGDFDSHMRGIMPIVLTQPGATRHSAELFDKGMVAYGYEGKRDSLLWRIDRAHWALIAAWLSIILAFIGLAVDWPRLIDLLSQNSPGAPPAAISDPTASN